MSSRSLPSDDDLFLLIITHPRPHRDSVTLLQALPSLLERFLSESGTFPTHRYQIYSDLQIRFPAVAGVAAAICRLLGRLDRRGLPRWNAEPALSLGVRHFAGVARIGETVVTVWGWGGFGRAGGAEWFGFGGELLMVSTVLQGRDAGLVGWETGHVGITEAETHRRGDGVAWPSKLRP